MHFIMTYLVVIAVCFWIGSGAVLFSWLRSNGPKPILRRYSRTILIQMGLPFLRDRWRKIDPIDFERLNAFRKRLLVRMVLLFVIPTVLVLLCIRLNIIYLEKISVEVDKRSEETDRRVEELLREE